MWNGFLEGVLQVYQEAVADQIPNWTLMHGAWTVVLSSELQHRNRQLVALMYYHY